MLKKIRLDLTDNCNLRCLMCTAYDGVSKSRVKFLNVEVFKQNCRGFLNGLEIIQLGNVAEPLLHGHFDSLVRFIRSETDAQILVQTNGLLLDRFAGVINDCGCTLNVSLDSLDPETYRYIRVGGSLERVLENLKLIDISKVDVFITQVLMSSNIGEFGNWVAYCRENGFKLSVVPLCIRERDGILDERLVEECLWFNKDKVRKWKERYRNDFSLSDVVAGKILTTGTEPLKDFTCSAHYDDVMIFADGTCNICFRKNIGNLNKKSLREIWTGDEAVRFRKDVENGEKKICAVCDYRTICLDPSIENFRNHLSKSLFMGIPSEVRAQMVFEGGDTDEEQKKIFLMALSASVKIGKRLEIGNSVYSFPLKFYRKLKLYVKSRMVS